MVGLMVGGKDIPPQPFHQSLGIGNRHAPESEGGANLFAIPLAAAARQVVLREGIRLDPELAGEVIPGGGGDLLPVAGKPTLQLKELQRDGEAESTPVGSPGQQLPLFSGQRPVLGEFLLVPVSFHDALSISFVLRSQGRADGTPSEGQRWGAGRQQRGWAGTSWIPPIARCPARIL